jgi:hypothetical protein
MHEAAESILRESALLPPLARTSAGTPMRWTGARTSVVRYFPTRWPSCPGVVAVTAASVPYCDIDVTVL